MLPSLMWGTPSMRKIHSCLLSGFFPHGCSFLVLTGTEAKVAGGNNGLGSRFFDAAQWLIGGGARIESQSIAPQKKQKKGGDDKRGGKAGVTVQKK